MPVKEVRTLGWTRSSLGVTVLAAMDAQRKQMAARVRALRDQRGWTNETLAYKAGVSVKTVSRLVNGRHDPRDNTLRKVAKALRTTPAELRGAPPAMPRSEATDLARALNEISARLAHIEALLGACDTEPTSSAGHVPRGRRPRAA
jgi:transcriptional regulator with XRE-family HTH domain